MRDVSAAGDAAWDRLVTDLPAAHVLQSAAWGQLKARWGWTVHRFAWGPAGSERAAAQVLVRRMAGGSARLAYCPRGPIVRNGEAPVAWQEVVGDLESWARDRRLLAAKIDPSLPASSSPVIALWRRRGWRPAAAQIQFPNTMVTDLTVGRDELLARMKPKTRYNIGLAERRGVSVRRGEESDLATFFDLYAATASRGGFGVRSWAYYRDAWTTLLRSGSAVLLLAERDGQALAGVLPVAYGGTALYLYGASSDRDREHMPAYLAQWHSLLWAIDHGCRTYDWWGAPTRLEPDDPMWGVYQFKRGFGATLVEQVGAWDYPPRPLLYAALALAERLRHSLIRARHRRI